MQRRYSTENIVNCRDLGGYPTASGEATAFGKALRCGIITPPSQSDMQMLESYGVKTVIDLRGNGETKAMPSGFESAPGIDYHHISLLETNPDFSRKSVDMAEMYIYSLTEYSANYAAALRLISGLTAPFLLHCFAGKDRTGLLSALLLSAAGVCREDILADYMVSFIYFRPFYERELALNTGVIWEKDPNKFYSDPETLARALDYLDLRYGSVRGYFEAIGLNETEIESLSRTLID